jgi:hypothetical protein
MIRFHPLVRKHAIPGVLLHPSVRKRAIPGALFFVAKRAFVFLLALVVAGTPLSPVFAVVDGSDSAHAVPDSHDGDHRADGSAQTDPHSKSCPQHDSSVDQCCAHCFGVVSLVLPGYLHSHPVQTPVLNQLHPFFLITSPDRPPRFLSL